jgi:hypothetical protein
MKNILIKTSGISLAAAISLLTASAFGQVTVTETEVPVRAPVIEKSTTTTTTTSPSTIIEKPVITEDAVGELDDRREDRREMKEELREKREERAEEAADEIEDELED